MILVTISTRSLVSSSSDTTRAYHSLLCTCSSTIDGGWLKSHSLPADRGVYGTFTELQDENRKVILSILEGKDHDANTSNESEEERAERGNLKKLRTGYAACMDVVRFFSLTLPTNTVQSDLTKSISRLGPYQCTRHRPYPTPHR